MSCRLSGNASHMSSTALHLAYASTSIFIISIFTSAELREGVDVVAAVLIDEGVDLGEGEKENWPFFPLQIPPGGKALGSSCERFIQPEKVINHIRGKLYICLFILNHWFASDVMPVWLHPVLVTFRLQFSTFHKTFILVFGQQQGWKIHKMQKSHIAVSRSVNIWLQRWSIV